MTRRLLLALTFAASGCATSAPAPAPAATPAPRFATYPEEVHLQNVRQLTFGGENAEAYWSGDGTQLIYQGRTGEQKCDQIYRMRVADDPPHPLLVGAPLVDELRPVAGP